MIAPTIPRRPRVIAERRPRNETQLLLAAAHRGAITYREQAPWPVFLVNDHANPDVRPLIAGLISDGYLEIRRSQVRPTAAGLARLGISA